MEFPLFFFSQWILNNGNEIRNLYIFFLLILVILWTTFTNHPYTFSKIVILLGKELIAGTVEIYERTGQVFREEFYEESQSNNGIANNNCCSAVL